MQCDILTIFPEFFNSPLKVSLLGKAIKDKKLSVTVHNFRDFAEDKHQKVDDIPYGGGPGMVMKPEPLVRAVRSIPKQEKSLCVLLSPRGVPFSQQKAKEWAGLDQLLLICGRYEGVDERVRELVVDEEISIGDYILNGGEAAALVVLDALVRLLPGVVGNEASLEQESFSQNLLEYPQYTRPVEFEGLKVPEVLVGGHHKEIGKWREEKALALTKERRPDLHKKHLKELQKNKKPAR